MSLFLAPIHYWLFKKIRLNEELEKNIINAYKNTFKDETIDEVVENGVNKFGRYIEDKPLEDLIDTSNIHGWLQEKITIEESRSAFILETLLNQYGIHGKNIAFEEVRKQASSCAKEVCNINSPSEVFDKLNEYILEGMPCDRVNSILENEESRIVWSQDKCIHINNYKSGDVEYMYEIRDLWVKTFVENISPGYLYNIKRDNEKSMHEIILK